jgi:dolichyl-phosphate beta-glucosyltransferase
MSDSVNLSLVVPCYNEEQRIPRFEKLWLEFAQTHGSKLFRVFPKIEIIFVNDGSRDRTEGMLKDAASRVSQSNITARYESLERNQGKGAAVRRGFQKSTGEWVLMTDVDLSCPLPQIFKLMDAQVDFALGSRALAESLILRAQTVGRPSLGRLFNFAMRAVTGIPFLDTQCGFKLLRGSLARSAAEQLIENRFAFDVELVLIANHMKASMIEVPVEWEHQEPSRVMVWKDGMQMISRVIALTVHHGRWRS